MKLVEFKTVYPAGMNYPQNGVVYINPEQVASVFVTEGSVSIVLVNSIGYVVEGTVQEVLLKLTGVVSHDHIH